MKKLQNDFTTPEQSNRLLELGVPEESANCCLRRILTDGGYCETWIVDVFSFIGQVHDDYLPCWSSGRLMEIFELCTGRQFIRRMDRPLVEDVKCRIAFYIHHHKFDFSKLEE